jgi:hypothetical protein
MGAPAQWTRPAVRRERWRVTLNFRSWISLERRAADAIPAASISEALTFRAACQTGCSILSKDSSEALTNQIFACGIHSGACGKIGKKQHFVKI